MAVYLHFRAFLFIPWLGFTWSFFQSRLADLFMAPILIYAVFSDVLFYIGFDHALYLRAPGSFQMFFFLWALWQIPLFVLLIVRLKWFAYNLGERIQHSSK